MALPIAPPLLTRVRPTWWRAADGAVTACYGAAAGLLLAKQADAVLPLLGALACAVALAWPIAARSRWPAAAFLVSLLALAVVAVWQPRSASAALVPLGLTLYTLTSRTRPPGAIAALSGALTAAVSTALPDFRHTGGAVLFGSAYLVLWTIGFAVGMNRRYTALALRAQAQQARTEMERARHRLARQRMDIARELHDVVAHHMSVITVQAGYGGMLLVDGAAETAAAAPCAAQARAVLSVIETTGRQALDEMRRLVEVLRAEDGEPESAEQEAGHTPAPGLGDLPRLIERAAHAGVHVSVTTAGAECALPPGEDLAAYRIVQEALTNVIKHGGGDTAELHLRFGEQYLEIQVTNDATEPGPEPGQDAARSPGHGTAGMRERAALYGGELDAGPTGEGGYRIWARLPLLSLEHTTEAPVPPMDHGPQAVR
ncbi:histidine kinase [Streptomyces sp. NPDC013172]|uniref:sensor histidine kinase n=1 Tax=Streptomyces sp. NPDC013172 TaxID=3155009 RepID=UPI0033E95826